MISTEKQSLRSRMLESLRAMSDAERAEKSAAIAGHLAGMGGVVFGFAPMRMEPDWTGAIGAGWQVALPRVEGGRMVFLRVGFEATGGSGVPPLPMGRDAAPSASDFSGLVRGPFGVREPADGEIISFGAADVVLTPGVAFDRMGARLGRGRGFYDRLLADPALTARRVAVCFACQLVGRVPVEPHDAKMDAIVTEDGWIEVRSSGRGRD